MRMQVEVSGAPSGARHRRRLAWVVLACVLGATACQDDSPVRDTGDAPVGDTASADAALPAGAATGPREVPRSGGGTVGGDGSPIRLLPLTRPDLDANPLSGELACAFIDGGDTLLLAHGDVASDEPARGLVRVGDYVEPVATPGGFDAMLRGARFDGRGTVVVITPDGPAVGRGESPPVPATLTFHRADGARLEVSGQWQCGP